VTAVPAVTPSTDQFVQIEPGANAIAVGVRAENIFSDATSNIFTDLANAVAALHGTGNPAADRTTLETTMTRLNTYASLSSMAQATVGINMNGAETAADNLGNSFLHYDERAAAIEDADFAESATGLTSAQQALDATLQVAGKGRRSLFDFLG
jgi:flagellin-like hook-associated protein FlgL